MYETQSISANAPIDDSLSYARPGPKEVSPNKGDIAAHLYALFPPVFVQPYPEAWIEIAYGNPATGNAVNKARNFSAFELKEAGDFAAAKNAAGSNVYVGVALRKGSWPESGRANDDNFLASAYVWAEFDELGDDERIDAILKEAQLGPAMVVTTGRVPHLRAHLYFSVEQKDGADRAKLVAALKALKILLDSDDVDNASRVMRLAGTVNWPTPKKS